MANVSNLISRDGIEALDRADEPEEPVRDEILLIHVGRQARPHAPGDELHERRVGEDQPIAEILLSRLSVILPKGLDRIRGRHGKRIRRAQADSSAAATSKHAAREIAQPDGEHTSGKRDHPRGPTLERGIDGNEAEACAERSEQEPEKPPLHASNGATQGRGTIRRPRGVAQLVERRSPKP